MGIDLVSSIHILIIWKKVLASILALGDTYLFCQNIAFTFFLLNTNMWLKVWVAQIASQSNMKHCSVKLTPHILCSSSKLKIRCAKNCCHFYSSSLSNTVVTSVWNCFCTSVFYLSQIPRVLHKRTLGFPWSRYLQSLWYISMGAVLWTDLSCTLL